MSGDDHLVRDALERFQPAPQGGRADWGDVRDRAAVSTRGARLRRVIGWGAAVAGTAALVALVAVLLINGPRAAQAPPAVGDPAPPVTFRVLYPDPTYGIVTPRTPLSSLRGQVVVLSFINTTCSGCAAAADVLGYARMTPASAMIVVSGEPVARALDFATAPVVVTAPGATTGPPSVPKGSGAAPATIKTYRGTATAADPNGELGRAFGVTQLPTIVVIDRMGRIARRYTKPPQPEAFQEYLARLASQPPPVDLPSPQPPEPHLSLFDDPSALWNGYPPSLMPKSLPCPHVRGSFRLAAKGSDGEALLVGQGLAGSLFTISHYGGNLGGSIGCGAARTEDARLRGLRQTEARGYALAESSRTAGRYVISMLLLDGFNTITIDGVSYRVPHNGFIRSFPRKPARIVISGPAGKRVVRVS